jgi:protein gp37
MPTGISYLDETWNLVLGCEHESKGCNFCWSEAVSHAHSLHPNPKIAEAYSGVTKDGKWTGTVKCMEDRLEIPLHWRKPRTVGVSFMGDIYHKDVPFEFIDKVFVVMAQCPQHTFIVPTKRYARMFEYCSNPDRIKIILGGDVHKSLWPLPNVWLMPSVSNQADADLALPLLMKTPAAKRLVSFEPALEMTDFSKYIISDLWYMAECGDCGYIASSEFFNSDGETCDCPKCYSSNVDSPVCEDGIDGLICGGESGTGARPMHPDIPRQARDQCAKGNDVSYYFKQWGEYLPAGSRGDFCFNPGASIHDLVTMTKVGKKAAGCLLDGVEHTEWPGSEISNG